MMKTPTAGPSNSPEWLKKLEGAAGRALNDKVSAAKSAEKNPDGGSRSVSFHCAKNGREFSVIFTRSSRYEKFHIHETQIRQNDLATAVPAEPSQSQSLDANEMDFSGWQCVHCQHHAWPQFVKCGSCHRLVCGVNVVSHQNGQKTFTCAPGCERSGVLEGQITSYDSASAGTQNSTTGLLRGGDGAPKLTKNSTAFLPKPK